MIKEKDWKKLQWFYRIMIWGRYIPWEMDSRSGKVSIVPSLWHRLIWRSIWIAQVIVCGIITIRFGLAVTGISQSDPLFMAYHVTVMVTYMASVYVAYRMFVLYPDVNVAIFNRLNDYSRQGNQASANSASPTVKTTINEYVILVLPVMIYGFNNLVFTFNMITTGDVAPVFVYSAFPKEWQSTTMAVIVHAAQWIPGYEIYTMFNHMMIVTVVFFQRCIETLIETEIRLKRPDLKDTDILKEPLKLRMIQLELNLFNIVMADICFAKKIHDLAITISSVYYAIIYAHQYLALSIGLMYVGVFEAMLYCLNFDKAFKIPGKIDDSIRQVDSISIRISDENGRKYVRKLLKSIPTVGIKCGQFHFFERASTINFLSFAADKIIGLVVSSREV